MSANDPTRTSAGISCCSSEAGLSPYQSTRFQPVRCRLLSQGRTCGGGNFLVFRWRAAAWPFAARAQQPERMRRIGVLVRLAADDAEYQARIAAFLQGLRSWAGPTAATCGSTSLGHGQCRPTSADTRPNWSRSRRTSSCRRLPRPWRRCCRRPAPCRSCSDCPRSGRLRLRRRAWRGRAATPPASCSSNTA